MQDVNEHLSELVDDKVNEIREKDSLMVQQSKNAAMGEMISMIAHQWRQPLSSVSAISSKLKLQSQLGVMDNIEEDMQEIIELSRYLSDTIDDFRNYFKPTLNRQETLLSEIIERSIKFTSHYLLSNDIEVQNRLEDCTLLVIRNDIIQVFINIIKNSIDAFVENKIKNRKIEISSYIEKSSLHVRVKDNAGGISVDIIDAIFDEYFSTKGEKGTGLGLYMSKMIIEKRYEGEFDVFSVNDETIFDVKLPLI